MLIAKQGAEGWWESRASRVVEGVGLEAGEVWRKGGRKAREDSSRQ